jgi:hypothetical protein
LGGLLAISTLAAICPRLLEIVGANGEPGVGGRVDQNKVDAGVCNASSDLPKSAGAVFDGRGCYVAVGSYPD